MFIRKVLVGLLTLAEVFLLAACGGSGTQVAGGGTGGTGISTGVMTKGSVIVNGIRFEDTLANITIDDTSKLPADLQDGMVVKVRGKFNDDGLTGEAEKIEAENEVQGAISGFGPEADAFTVSSQNIFVDGGTVFANVAGLSGLSVGNRVEVHALRDSGNNLRATRVELLAGARALEPDELKGTVSGLNPTDNTFLLGTQLVDYTVATIRPAGALGNGILVEVHGSLSGATFIATFVDLEDLEDAGFDPAEGEEVEVEGFVSGFTALSSPFFVNGRLVDASGARFEGGVPGDMANDVRVEAEGHMSGALLLVEKIEFKESIRIESNATGSTADSVTLLGKSVFITSQTEKNGFTDPSELVNQGVKVRGFVNMDGTTITATRIDIQSNPVDADKHILQGPVSSFNAPARTLTIVGINVNASSVSANDVKNADDQVITIDQFFALLTANRTIVKTRGTFAAGTITANQIEIE